MLLLHVKELKRKEKRRKTEPKFSRREKTLNNRVKTSKIPTIKHWEKKLRVEVF